MEADEFVKKFGWFAAEDYLTGCAIVDNHLMVFTNVEELKRLVKGHKLVESYGGMTEARIKQAINGNKRLKQAIIDVESCV